MRPSKNFFVALVELDAQLEWLETALGAGASLVRADEPSIDRVLQLADTASATAVFVRFGPLDHAQRGQFVLRMLERKPSLAVIALAESDDPQLMLSVLRSGARDLVPLGADSAELHAAVERVLSRHAAIQPRRAGGGVHAVVCARPDGTSASFATHLTLAIRRQVPIDEKVLLLDLGTPVGDSLLLLDLRPTYSFADAVRSVRRFDQTLIHAAFARHSSGISVLALPEDPADLEGIRPADAIALTGVLKAYFDHIVINLSGLFDLDQLFAMLEKASSVLVHTDQCVATCRANYRLLEAIRQAKVPLEESICVVDRFQPRVDPPPEQIAELLNLERWFCLPPEGIRMLQGLNTGRSILDQAPTCGYSRAISQMASAVLKRESASTGLGWVDRLRARFQDLRRAP